jgi:tetratricopeptide (TPR) repeat protein
MQPDQKRTRKQTQMTGINITVLTLGLMVGGFLARAQETATKPSRAPVTPEIAQESGKVEAQAALDRGVRAYKSAKYSEAIESFKRALELDPDTPNARSYLATTYMTVWKPGVDSPENSRLASEARSQFMTVLSKDPNDRIALASLASLAYNEAGPKDRQNKLDEAWGWNLKLVNADPQNKEAYYSLGVIAWSKWYPAYEKARADLGLKPDDPGPFKDPAVRAELRSQYSTLIHAGIQNLTKALEIDPQYEDAMAYMNLLIRQGANLADSSIEYDEQIHIADNWVQKALDTKKKKAGR